MQKPKISLISLLPALLFIAPLVNSNAFVNKVVTPKLFFFFLSLSAIALLMLFVKTASARYQRVFAFTLTDVFMACFPLYAFVRIITYKNGMASDPYFFTLAGLTVFYFLVKIVFTGHNNQNTRATNPFAVYATIMVIVGILQLAWGFLQYFNKLPSAHPVFKITGGFDNPGPYAAYIATVFPLALWVLYQKPFKSIASFFSLLYIAGSLVMLPLTQARASWLGVTAALALVLAYRFWPALQSYFPVKKKFILVAAIAAMLAVALLAGNYLYHYKTQSSQGRLFIWKNNLALIVQKPLFGHGFNSYPVKYNETQEQYFRDNPDDAQNAWLADNIEYAFNEYLQISTELGLAGLIIFLSPIFFLSLIFFRSKNKTGEQVIAMAGLACVLVMAFVSYPFRNLPVLLHFYFFIALLSLSDKKPVRAYQLPKQRYVKLYLAAMVVVALFAAMQLKRLKAHKEWKKVALDIRKPNNQRAIDKYRDLYPLLRHDKFFLYNYGAEFSVIGLYAESVDILEETSRYHNDADTYIYLANSYLNLGNVSQAEESLVKASYIMPGKFYPQYKLVHLYEQTGRRDEALLLAQKILERPVKIHSPLIESIKKEMQEYIDFYIDPI